MSTPGSTPGSSPGNLSNMFGTYLATMSEEATLVMGTSAGVAVVALSSVVDVVRAVAAAAVLGAGKGLVVEGAGVVGASAWVRYGSCQRLFATGWDICN